MALASRATVRFHAIAVSCCALIACARRGEVRHHHTIDPPAFTATSDHHIRATRIAGANAPTDRHRAAPWLWVELELTNRGPEPWELRTTDVQLANRRATWFAEYPSLAPDASGEIAIVVAPRATRTTWVRFADVHTQNAEAARNGMDDPATLELVVEGRVLRLSDPVAGTPAWTPSEWPYFATLAYGFGGRIGLEEANTRQGSLGFDFALAGYRRFGEFDVGVRGVVQGGVDVDRQMERARPFSFLGGGVASGYTFRLGSALYVRVGADAVLGRAGHGEVETTPLWLGGELHFGVARRGLYPYRERPTNFTFAWYLRGEGRAASFSTAREPYVFGASAGIVLRGGS